MIYFIKPFNKGFIEKSKNMTKSGFQEFWYTPIFSSFLKQRKESLFLIGVGAIQVCLVFAHLPGWPCPFKAAFGLPCPGCGLSTASSLLLHGQWSESFKTHAFAPFFLAGMFFIVFANILPNQIRNRLIEKITRIEEHSGFLAWFLLTLFIYWGFRLFGHI